MQTFLLFQETGADSWIQTLRHTRETYTERRDHFLKFIRHPESLAEISSDPLNDDPEVSPPMPIYVLSNTSFLVAVEHASPG